MFIVVGGDDAHGRMLLYCWPLMIHSTRQPIPANCSRGQATFRFDSGRSDRESLGFTRPKACTSGISSRPGLTSYLHEIMVIMVHGTRSHMILAHAHTHSRGPGFNLMNVSASLRTGRRSHMDLNGSSSCTSISSGCRHHARSRFVQLHVAKLCLLFGWPNAGGFFRSRAMGSLVSANDDPSY